MFLDRILDYLKQNGRDLKLFLLSLLLAFSVWMIYNLTLNYTKVVSVPIVAVSNISGHRQVSSNTAVVLARCHTRGFDLLKIEKASENNPIHIKISPSDLHAKTDELYYITSSELDTYVKDIFGDQAGMESFVTDSLFFRFALENSKKVPIQPVVSMSYMPQYMAVGDLKLEPDSVIVYSEPVFLDKIDRVYTKSFELSDLKSTVHGEVKLEGIKGVRMSHEQTEYVVEVQRYVEISTTLPIHYINVPSNKELEIYPSSAKVTLRCVFPLTLNPEESLNLYIDYNDFQNSINGVCIPKTNELPSGLIDYVIEPEVFECVERDR